MKRDCSLSFKALKIIPAKRSIHDAPETGRYALGPDYMSRAGPASRVASVCRVDFQADIT